GSAQVQRVTLARDVLERPDPAIELGGLLQVVDAQLDAAQAVDSEFAHSPGSPVECSIFARIGLEITAKIGGLQQPPRRSMHSSPAPVLVAFATRTEQIRTQEPV